MKTSVYANVVACACDCTGCVCADEESKLSVEDRAGIRIASSLSRHIIGGSVGGGVAVLIGIAGMCWRCRRKQNNPGGAGAQTGAMSEIGGHDVLVLSVNPVSTNAQVGHMHSPTHQKLHSEATAGAGGEDR